MRRYYYTCDSCPSTRLILDPHEQRPAPLEMGCGWRGCTGTLRKVGKDTYEKANER